ncbi:Uma2 family endonuclease [Singulisphaera rosea]
MASPSRVQETMTLEAFLALPEEKPYLEYIDGQIEPKVSPQFKHGWIEFKLTESLNRYAEPLGLGFAVPELRCTFVGRSIIPDVAFLMDSHVETDNRGEFSDEIWRPSDLHVEILSPEQSIRKTREKLEHSTSNGCQLGWLIDPGKKTVDVFRPGQLPERLSADGFLDGGAVLPGYRVSATEIFGWLRRQGNVVPPSGEPEVGPA